MLRLMSAAVVGMVLLGAAAPVWAGDVDGDGVNDAIDMCKIPIGQNRDRHVEPFGRRPQPVHCAVVHPGLFVWLQERIAQAVNAGCVEPAGEFVETVRCQRIDTTENGKPVREALRCIKCEWQRSRIPTGRVEDGAMDAGNIHFSKRLLKPERFSAVLRHDIDFPIPKVDLRINDFHGTSQILAL